MGRSREGQTVPSSNERLPRPRGIAMQGEGGSGERTKSPLPCLPLFSDTASALTSSVLLFPFSGLYSSSLAYPCLLLHADTQNSLETDRDYARFVPFISLRTV